MGSDEERLEEMLKAVLEEENKRTAQNTPDVSEEEDLPEIPELPLEDVTGELPDLPLDDLTGELQDLPLVDLSEDLQDLPLDDLSGELSEIEDLPLDDFSEDLPEIEDLPLDDLSEEIPEIPEQDLEKAEDPSAKEMSVDPLEFLAMSEEEIDKVLEKEASLDKTFTGKAPRGEMPEEPKEQDALSDIEEMLQMSDDHVLMDEEGMGKGMSSGGEAPEQDFSNDVPDAEEEIREVSDNGKKKKSLKKKREKKVKEKKKKESGENKESFGKKFAAVFFGSDEEELEEEPVNEKKKGKEKSAADGDAKGKKKKEKKQAPPKKDKEKDPAKAAKEKLKKEKQAEKAKLKAAKAEKAEKERRAAKKLPKKRVIVWTLLCASIGVGILLINSVGMAAIQMTQARNAFYDKDFETAYKLLNGRELSGEDQLIFGQSSAVLHLEHAQENYKNHLKMNKPVKALEDLLKGVEKYQGVLSAGGGELVTPELTAEYQRLLEILQEQYGVSEAGAIEINAIKTDYEYSLQLEALVNGGTYQNQSEIQEQEEEAAQTLPELEDMLPEEEEYLDGSGD